MSRAERRRQIKLERKLYNNAPHMINEKKYVPMNCVICNEMMKDIHDTHNPYPVVAENSYATAPQINKNRCCTKCDDLVVLPARTNDIPMSNALHIRPMISLKKEKEINAMVAA